MVYCPCGTSYGGTSSCPHCHRPAPSHDRCISCGGIITNYEDQMSGLCKRCKDKIKTNKPK